MKLLSQAITAAVAGALSDTVKLNGQPRNLTIQANFVYGSGGTTVDAYVQTSLDGGVTWADIAEFSFATSSARKIFNLSAATVHATEVTPTDGSLTGNTSVDGVLGSQYRVKYTTVGTYAATTLAIDLSSDQIQ